LVPFCPKQSSIAFGNSGMMLNSEGVEKFFTRMTAGGAPGAVLDGCGIFPALLPELE
jgi:hypothetical protein